MRFGVKKNVSSRFITFLVFLSSFLLLGCSANNTIKLQLNEKDHGHYFIIWTSNTAKFSSDLSKPIKFDRNKVVYLDYHLKDSLAVKPVNLRGEDISKRLKNFMANEFYMNFYNPTDDEYLEHPNWDIYYLDKRPDLEKAGLELKGYSFKDTLIRNKLIKLGKYQSFN